MANWCDWDCTIVTVEPEKLFQQIQAKIAEARQRNTALFIGSDRYLFDSCVEITGDEITLTGNAKWCFCPDEMEKFVLFLRRLNDTIQSVEVQYEETGCGLFGRYCYEDGGIVHTFIDSDLPEWHDGDESYYDKLVETLEESGVTESWVMKNEYR